MSVVIQLWDSVSKQPSFNNSLSTESTLKSYAPSPRSASPTSTVREKIFDNYVDLIHSKSNLSTEAKKTDHIERPFDFYDDEEFAFGINLLNNNVACVGDNITKLIQMAQEPWPSYVKLFQPYEVEQILLPDNASCLAVQAFLKMCNLPFEVEMRWNAEFMSPSGRVPFIKCGAFVVSELEPIIQFAANKGVTLCSRISTEEKAEMRAYMSLISNVLVNAELYISWLDDETYNTVTKIRNSSVYPWPLGWLQTRSKRNAVAKRLKALNWYDKTLDQVLADVEQCCHSLSQRLGDKEYFFGSASPLDALVYGHIRALLSASGPRAAQLIKPITSALLRHVLKIAVLTKMKLKPQEEYLINQAFQVTLRRRPSLEAPFVTGSRIRKSRLCIKNANKGCALDIGFKPFASKDIIIRPSEDGGLTCHYEGPPTIMTTQEAVDYITEIIDDIMEKVLEIGDNFEIITNGQGDLKLDGITDEYLDTIDEVDTVVSYETRVVTDDDTHIVNNDDTHIVNNDDTHIVNNDDIHIVIDDDIHIVNDDYIYVVDDDDTHVVDDTDTHGNDTDSNNAVIDDEGFKTPLDDHSPTELDALVFGHVFTIITTRLPCRLLAQTVRRHETLVALAKRVDEAYFKRA